MSILKLREYRSKMRYSQRDIALLLNITQQCYCSWENGKTFPNGEKIIELCRVLNCTPNDLFGFYGDYKVTMNQIDQD